MPAFSVPGSGIGYHEQTEDEIYYVLSGHGTMTADGKSFDVDPGTAVLTRTGSSHGCWPTKPIMIGEISSVAPDRAQFLSDMFTQLPTLFPQVRAICWFNWRINQDGQTWDWPIEASAQGQFAQGIASSYWVGR